MNRLDVLEPERKRLRGDTCERETVEQLLSKYNAVGVFLVDLLDYLHLNATGVRKILKKHDKAIQIMGAVGENAWLTTSFLSNRMHAPESSLRKLVASEQVSYANNKIEFAVISLRELALMKGEKSNLKTISSILNSTPTIIRCQHKHNCLHYCMHSFLIDDYHSLLLFLSLQK